MSGVSYQKKITPIKANNTPVTLAIERTAALLPRYPAASLICSTTLRQDSTEETSLIIRTESIYTHCIKMVSCFIDSSSFVSANMRNPAGRKPPRLQQTTC
jgi:hypothetical protein